MLLDYFVKYMWSKFAPTAVTAKADHARTHWGYCGRSRRTGIKSRRPAPNLSFNEPNSTVCCSRCHFSPWSWFEETLLNNRLKQSAMQDSDAQNSCLKNAIFTWSTDKNLFTLATRKNSQKARPYPYVVTKTKLSEKNAFLARKTFSESLLVSVKCTKEAWYSFTPESKSMKYVIVMCFHHHTCCLSYVNSLAILSFARCTPSPTYRAR